MKVISTPQMRGAIFQKKVVPEPYVHQPYPSMRHHRDGRAITVQNAEEDAALDPEEWAKEAFPPPPKAPPAPPEPTKAELQKALKDLIAKHDELRGYLAEKTQENLSLRAELARMKAAQSSAEPPSEPKADGEAEKPEADKPKKPRK